MTVADEKSESGDSIIPESAPSNNDVAGPKDDDKTSTSKFGPNDVVGFQGGKTMKHSKYSYS